MKMVSLKSEEVTYRTQDQKTDYETCNTGSPSTSSYYITREARPVNLLDRDFQYAPISEHGWKIPFLALPKYPLVPKPYRVGKVVETLQHGIYETRYRDQSVTLIRERTDYWKHPTYWFSRCNTSNRFVLSDRREHHVRVNQDPNLFRGVCEHSLLSHIFEENETISRLVSDVATRLYELAEGDFDALTELAEFGKTIDMMDGLSRAVGTKDGRQELLNKIKKHGRLKALANGVLLGQYGLAPLVYSYHDLQKAAERKGRKKFRTKREIVLTNDIHSGKVVTRIQVTGTVHVKWTGVRFTVNPFRTAWELVPYSFVVDWFTNIGDLISAVGTHINPLIQLTGSVGVRMTREVLAESEMKPQTEVTKATAIDRVSRYNPAPPLEYEVRRSELVPIQPMRWTQRVDTFDRYVLSPELFYLYVENGLTPWRAALGAALAVQRIPTNSKIGELIK